MSRPHTEFFQSQALDWTPSDDYRGAASASKVLSRDLESGGLSRLLRLPPGWAGESTALDSMDEFLVLSGSVGVDDETLPRFSYRVIPANRPARLCSTDGAVLLQFLNPGAGGDPVSLDTAQMTWGSGIADSNLKFMGLGRKVLRDDPERRERVLLLTMAPQAYPENFAAPPISHPCAEEMYLLGGDVVSEFGTMRPGAYFWRPADIPHGPHGSHTGAFMLIRFVDGRHENHWSEESRAFDPDPPYRPVLPDDLAMLQLHSADDVY